MIRFYFFILLTVFVSNVVATHNNQTTATDHQNLNLSYDIYGGNAATDAANGGFAISADRSGAQSQTTQFTNSAIQANNINLDIENNTTLRGANIDAQNTLALTTQNLTVESVQNQTSSNSRSQGVNVAGGSSGPSSGGINNGNGRSNTTQTLLTTLTGENVDIDVKAHTEIKGATIAAIDENGNDNGQLNLSTNTLNASSLLNTHNSNNQSLDVGIGTTASIDYQNDRENELSKTLATIGTGDITITDTANSDTRMLNTDVQNNEVSIYDIESHQGLQGELDTRLLSESGRDQIAEEVLKTGMIANSIQLILTTKRVTVADFFHETDKANQTYEAVKAEIRNDPKLAQALQNPDLTPEQKEQMLDQITGAVLVKLGYATHNNILIATDEPGQNDQSIAGFYSTEDADAYINDQNIGDTEGLVTAAGHEASHAMDQQDGIDINNPDNRQDNNLYAENAGENLASYTNMALDISGYGGGMASSNSHTGNDSQYVQENNQAFSELDKTQGDNYCSGGYNCYGEQTEHILRTARINPQPIETLRHYQIRERINDQGIVVGYEAWNPETQNSIIMLPQELESFRKVVEAIPSVGYSLENMTNAQHTGANAAAGLYDEGYTKGVLDSTQQYITDPNTLIEITASVAGAGAGGRVFRFNVTKGAFSKVAPATAKQLQKKFKHAGDFGVTGNYNPANAQKFNQAIQKHLNASGTKEISGTYRGNPATFHTNPNSGLTVIQNPNGSFLSGWKLNPQQLQHVLKDGKL